MEGRILVLLKKSGLLEYASLGIMIATWQK